MPKKEFKEIVIHKEYPRYCDIMCYYFEFTSRKYSPFCDKFEEFLYCETDDLIERCKSCVEKYGN